MVERTERIDHKNKKSNMVLMQVPDRNPVMKVIENKKTVFEKIDPVWPQVDFFICEFQNTDAAKAQDFI